MLGVQIMIAERDARHIMETYRRYILACKKQWGSARSLIHYREIVQEYLAAKRRLLARADR